MSVSRAQWLERQCLEQGTFTPQKVLVIPRKRWFRPNMTEQLYTGTLRINQSNECLLMLETNLTSKNNYSLPETAEVVSSSLCAKRILDVTPHFL